MPAGTLVCDLHYEKSWDYRRRYSIPCDQVNIGVRPCSGTYACVCRHSEKEFYRMSKLMPIIPLDYPGLKTSLTDMWIDKVEETEEDEDEMSETTKTVLIAVASSVFGTILLCCLGYYIVTFCANRMNKVTYD